MRSSTVRWPFRLSPSLTKIELIQENLEGEFVTPLRSDGTLSYPDYPNIPAVTIDEKEFVGLGELDKTRLVDLELDTENGALRLGLEGIFDRATTRSGEFREDHRLTLFQKIRHGWRWGLLTTVALWLLSTTWLGYERWKKLGE